MSTIRVTFYVCLQDKKCINKTFSTIIGGNGNIFYKSPDLHTIIFKFKPGTAQTCQALLQRGLYVRINPFFFGTYAVTNVTYDNENNLLFECEVDLLETFKDIILAATATVTQSENGNKYLNNISSNYDIRPKYKKLNFSEQTPFNNIENNIIMITTKGNI